MQRTIQKFNMRLFLRITFKLWDFLLPPVRFSEKSKSVCLTFDDGPSAPYTLQISEKLLTAGHTATFFLTGQQIEKHPQIVKQLIKDGHSIGSHSYSHVNGNNCSFLETLTDFKKGHTCLSSYTNSKISLFRPPYGIHGFASRVFCLLYRCKPILWSCDSLDWEEFSDSITIFANVQNALVPGAIILFHDWIADDETRTNRTDTVNAIDKIITELKKLDLISRAIN